MLQALLKAAGLTAGRRDIVEFPDFGQAAALQQGEVDAATGFANNEPIQLRNAGIEPVVLTVDDVVPLPGPGLVTGTKTLETKADALKAFTAATLRAMEEITADPQKGLDAAFAAVPDLAADPALQRQILDATIATWKNARTGARSGRSTATAGSSRWTSWRAGPGAEPGDGGPAGGRVAAALTPRAAPRSTAPGDEKAGPPVEGPGRFERSSAGAVPVDELPPSASVIVSWLFATT